MVDKIKQVLTDLLFQCFQIKKLIEFILHKIKLKKQTGFRKYLLLGHIGYFVISLKKNSQDVIFIMHVYYHIIN